MNSQKTEKLCAVIVEDEPPMLRFLQKLVARVEAFGEIIPCTNAEEAIPLIEERKPQLVVSDIRMSGMSGLELAERVRKSAPEIHIVIITGYKSFDYAKTAIDLNIDAFITKPVDQTELNEVLIRVRDDCLKRRYNTVQRQLEAAFRTEDEELFATQLKEAGAFLGCALLVYYTGDMEQLFGSISRIEKQGFSISYKNAVFFFAEEESAEELFRYITVKISGTVRQKKTAVCIRLDFSEENGKSAVIEQMKNFYRTRLLSCIVPGEFYICLDGRTGSGEEGSTEWKGDEAVCRELELSVLSQNQAGIRQKLQQLFGLWQEKKVSVAWLRKRIHWFTAVCEKAGILKEDRISLNDWIDEEVLGMDSYAEVQEFLIQLLDKSFQLDKAAMEKGDEALFTRIRDLVLKNLENNYSLQEICNLFHVSQPYVRKVFIRYTGKTYNDFVLEEKINYAVKLISSNPAIPVKDLAATLGYEQLYFSTVFKKKTGMTPSQYRQSVLPAGTEPFQG